MWLILWVQFCSENYPRKKPRKRKLGDPPGEGNQSSPASLAASDFLSKGQKWKKNNHLIKLTFRINFTKHKSIASDSQRA